MGGCLGGGGVTLVLCREAQLSVCVGLGAAPQLIPPKCFRLLAALWLGCTSGSRLSQPGRVLIMSEHNGHKVRFKSFGAFKALQSNVKVQIWFIQRL